MSEELETPWQASFDYAGRGLFDTTFVILDLETTGASPFAGTAITEIGAIKVKGGREIERFNQLINPGTLIPQYITDLTGISEALVFDKPRIETVFPIFLEFLGNPLDTYLVAHNSPFDISFLKAASSNLKIKWPSFKTIDTVRLARKIVEKFEVGNYKLSTLSNFFETATSPSHRAMADVEATMDLFHKLLERVTGFNVYTIDDLLNFLGNPKNF